MTALEATESLMEKLYTAGIPTGSLPMFDGRMYTQAEVDAVAEKVINIYRSVYENTRLGVGTPRRGQERQGRPCNRPKSKRL